MKNGNSESVSAPLTTDPRSLGNPLKRNNPLSRGCFSVSVASATNRHPVDELVEVRERLRELEQHHDWLRDQILAGECGLVGDEHEASITVRTSERLDLAKIKAELGVEALRPFMTEREVRYVRTRQKG